MPRLTPILIGRKLKRPPSVIRNVLVILVELGLVASAARGLYELTPDGEETLERVEKRRREQSAHGLEGSLIPT
jgi:Mn-dependent DtxR family transcriptional regulator